MSGFIRCEVPLSVSGLGQWCVSNVRNRVILAISA
jgi:hypothetical protein